MQKAKIKYHQPTVQELQTQKMDQIFEMLKKQEEGISSLLKKYQSYEDQEDLNEVFSQKNRHSKAKQNRQKQQSSRKSKSLAKSRSKSNMLLPDILSSKQNQRLAVLLDRRKKKSSHTIQPVKTSLRKELQGIYKDRKKMRELRQKSERHNKSLSKQKSLQKARLASEYSTIVDGIEQRLVTNNTNVNSQATSKKHNPLTHQMNPHYATQQVTRQSQSIPQPLSIPSLMMLPQSSSPHSQPSDSQDQQIPFSYYQRQFKSKMTAQCIEQINYLYFSKNESIKDWSQSLLAMFERHDKEIVALRKKMRYLERFDDKFFAVDIYKSD